MQIIDPRKLIRINNFELLDQASRKAEPERRYRKTNAILFMGRAVDAEIVLSGTYRGDNCLFAIIGPSRGLYYLVLITRPYLGEWIVRSKGCVARDKRALEGYIDIHTPAAALGTLWSELTK